MRITFLSPPPNISGGERVIAMYARELIQLGHDVFIVCCRRQSHSTFSKVTTLLKGGGWPTTLKIGNSHYENCNIPFRVVEHDQSLGEQDVPDGDAVIATFWKTAQWASNLSPQKGQKFYLVQGDEGAILGWAGAEATYQLPMRHIYVSQWIADRIHARHPKATGITINNAIDSADFDRGPRNKPTENRFGMVWGGNLIKGGDLAVDAFLRARSRGLNVKLIAFGVEEPPKRYLSAMDEFVKQPTANAMVKIYASCTAWLFTSRFEGFGLPILEAMAARTPVIGTPTGAAPELIGQGGGILVPMEDPNAAADAIVRVAEMDAIEWGQLSQAAYRTASSYTWHEAALQFEKFLKSNQRLDSDSSLF